MRVLVPGRGMPHRLPAAVLLGGDDIRGHGHDVRVRAVRVLPLADRFHVAVHCQHRQLCVAVLGAGDAHVASGPRPGPRRRGGRSVAGHGTSGEVRGACHLAGCRR